MNQEANQEAVPVVETPAEPDLDTVLEGFSDEGEETTTGETPVVADPAEAGATEPTADLHTVVVDGTEQQVTLEDMKRDYSFRKHNEQRAAELNRQHEENEATRRMLEYAGYDTRQTQQQPQPQQGQYQPVQGQQIEFATPNEEMLYQELQTMKQQVGAINEQSQNQRLNTVIKDTQKTWDDFRSTHNDLDETALAARLEIINQNELPLTTETLDLVHKSFTDEATIAQKAVAEYQDKLRGNKEAALEPSTESGKHAPPNVRDMAEDDIVKLASQETWEEEY